MRVCAQEKASDQDPAVKVLDGIPHALPSIGVMPSPTDSTTSMPWNLSYFEPGCCKCKTMKRSMDRPTEHELEFIELTSTIVLSAILSLQLQRTTSLDLNPVSFPAHCLLSHVLLHASLSKVLSPQAQQMNLCSLWRSGVYHLHVPIAQKDRGPS